MVERAAGPCQMLQWFNESWRALQKKFGDEVIVLGGTKIDTLTPTPPPPTRFGIENTDAFMPCCGVHYL